MQHSLIQFSIIVIHINLESVAICDLLLFEQIHLASLSTEQTSCNIELVTNTSKHRSI
jgi:hypothetical protein